jgi:hypothetical protein
MQACLGIQGGPIFRDAATNAGAKMDRSLVVDASRCATTSGRFEIVFSRLKENGIEIEFREQFMWRPDSVGVSVDFWADEAVERYWLDNVAACPCRD